MEDVSVLGQLAFLNAEDVDHYLRQERPPGSDQALALSATPIGGFAN
jgi:hypothetical protein